MTSKIASEVMSLARINSNPPILPAKVHKLLRMRLADEDLELPVLSDTAMQVLALADEEECDARGLAELLARDQSLASHVLRVANSAAYAPKEPIVSLQQAVSRMGFPTVREIAISVAVRGKVFDVPGHRVRVRELWMHSAAAAVFCREVSRQQRANVEAGFLCGLLHDVGKPMIAQVLSDEARKHTDRPIPAPILEAAMDAFHVELGSRMVRHWKLPDWIVGAIENHHDIRTKSEYQELARLTNLADELSHWALMDSHSVEDFPAELPVIRGLGIYAEDVVKLLEMRGPVLEVVEAFL
ncbi:MAG: putative nucleotidyltransferase with HDIG domain [Planctomycetota bacterium]|jgi:putative nucleotidyltransferase with HDIG domain